MYNVYMIHVCILMEYLIYMGKLFVSDASQLFRGATFQEISDR